MLARWPPGLLDYWLAFHAAENEPQPDKPDPKQEANRIEAEQAMLAGQFGKGVKRGRKSRSG